MGHDHDAGRRAWPGMHVPLRSRAACDCLHRLVRQAGGTARDGRDVEIRRERSGSMAAHRVSAAARELLPDLPEQAAEHHVVREVLARDLLRGAGVARIVGVDRLHGREDLLHGGEREQSLAGREHVAEAGVLVDHRAPGGQVGGAAVAEPAGAQAHVLVLRHRVLAARARDVVTVVIRVDREVERMTDLPSVALEQLLVSRFIARQRQLERLGRSLRQVDELHELVVLAPAVALAVEDHVAPRLAPVADRGQLLAGARPSLPEVHDHRLPGGVQREAVLERQAAVRIAVVLGVAEECAVRLEEVERRLHPLVELGLKLHRVGLEVHEPVRRVQLGAWLGAAVHVDHHQGGVVQPPQLSLAQSVAAVVVVEAVERPPVGHAEPAHHAVDEGGRLGGAVLLLALHQHRGVRACAST